MSGAFPATTEFDEIAREIDARADEVPPRHTRELLERIDARSGEAIVYVGRMAAELARSQRREAEARARLEKIVGDRFDRIEQTIGELLLTKRRVDSMAPKVGSSHDLAKEAHAAAKFVEAEIHADRKEELKALRAEGRDWGKWAVRGAVGVVIAAAGAIGMYLLQHGGLP